MPHAHTSKAAQKEKDKQKEKAKKKETSKEASKNSETPSQKDKRKIEETLSPANTHDVPASETVETGSHVRDIGNPFRRQRTHSLGDITDITDAAGEKSDASLKLSHQGKTYNMSHLIQQTLSNKAFIDSIAPLLAASIQSHLNQMIENATQPLKNQLAEHQASICTLQAEVSETNDRISDAKEENQQLKDEIKGLAEQVQDLEGRHDDLEQYGRRNNLRFYNVPMAPTDDTEALVLDICNNKLKLSPPITTADIERCHIIGTITKASPEDETGTAQIICKFKGWKTKKQVYKAKSSLKKFKTPQYKVFINEDLTRKRQSMIKILSSAKKVDKIDSYWSFDGRVYYKETDTSNRILVKNISQIDLLE